MKKSILFAAALLVGVGGATAQIFSPEVKKADGTYTYYEQGNCNVEITCDDDFEGPSCAETYSGTVLYYQPGCQVTHVVASPLGKLPQ